MYKSYTIYIYIYIYIRSLRRSREAMEQEQCSSELMQTNSRRQYQANAH